MATGWVRVRLAATGAQQVHPELEEADRRLAGSAPRVRITAAAAEPGRVGRPSGRPRYRAVVGWARRQARRYSQTFSFGLSTGAYGGGKRYRAFESFWAWAWAWAQTRRAGTLPGDGPEGVRFGKTVGGLWRRIQNAYLRRAPWRACPFCASRHDARLIGRGDDARRMAYPPAVLTLRLTGHLLCLSHAAQLRSACSPA